MTTPGRLVLSAIDPVLMSNGTLANGAVLNFYQSGGTTPAVFYTDNTLGNPVQNPQISNAGGRFYEQCTSFWSDASVAYNIQLSMPDGEIYNYDPTYLVAAPVDTSGFLKNPNVMLTGVPTAPTPAANDSSSKIATTAFVQAAINAAINALSIFPVGSEITLPVSTIIAGWGLENGQSVTTAANPVLFSLIGYTFGGSGANFNLPDMQGRGPRGANPTGSGPGPTTVAGTLLADAFQGHIFYNGVADNNTAGNTSMVYGRTATGVPGDAADTIHGDANPINAQGLTSAPITDGSNGTPRIANETRGSSSTKFWYIKLG